jgi:hypothetical protein
MNVIIKLQMDVALALTEKPSVNGKVSELLATAKEAGVELKPLHPNVKDQVLMTYYYVEVPIDSNAENVAGRFRACKAVEAAYIKPPDELP